MKKYKCVKNYHFYVNDTHPNEVSFSKDEIYTPKDIDYEGGGILFVDDQGDDHFINDIDRIEYFTPINNFKFGK